MPKISIIFTSFNHEKYIREAIDSALNQTFTDFELIILDDGSSDNSWALINQYSDPRIKAFRNEVNKGSIEGMNKAISEVAAGKYIAVHHSDDVWELDKLEKQVAFLDANPEIGAVFTWVQIIDEHSVKLARDGFDQKNKSRWQWLNQLFHEQNRLNHPSVLIRKQCYQDVGVYRYGLAQTADAEMWSRVLIKFPIHIIQEKLTMHRRFSDKSNTSSDKIEAIIRANNEWNVLRENYLSISSFEEIVATFPNLERFRNPEGFDNKFLLAMACLYECKHRSAWQLGLTWLFELINDEARYEKIKKLYSFSDLDFIRLTAEFDVYFAEWDKKIAERDEIINGLYTSRSWQLTRPLRFFAQPFRKPGVLRYMESDLLTLRATKPFGFRDALSKVMPRPIKRILRKLIGMVERTQLIRLIVPKLNVLGNFDSIVAERKTVLVVSHEGSRTGAPILSYNLVKGLLRKYNVVALFLGPGPLLNACHALGAIVVGSEMIQGSLLRSELAIKQIVDAVQIKFALINSIESRYALPALAKYHIPTVSLIHEFAAYTRPHGAFRETVFWSGQTVFSTRITLDNMVAEYPDLGAQECPVLPQGRCVLPGENNYGVAKQDRDASRIGQAMRPEGFASEGIVIIGIGSVCIRKGVDLFLQCAAHVLQKAPDLPFRFVWVGKVYDPDGDMAYSAFLADQIRRAGLEEHIHFLDEVADLDTVYALADILLLSSRLDPLPNVAIDAFAAGLPIVCFDKTTGIVDFLSEHGLGDACVAAYLDTEEMARKVIALAESNELRVQIGGRSAKIASETFDMAKYVTQIEKLALKQVDRYRQAELDIDTIAKSDLLRLDYFRRPHSQHQSRDEAIRWYVRSWVSGVGRRKLFPGFHPGIYLEQHGIESGGVDPLADYLRAGQPRGPWNFELITSAEEAKHLQPRLRIGLHIHAYYPDLFPEILERLKRNRVRPDLLVSVTSESARLAVASHLGTYVGGEVDIRVVPDRGRDIGPFLTEFGKTIRQKYDLIGHLHTKKTADLKDELIGRDWYQFLLENLLGGQASMADIILGRMADDQNVMMVFPDDPNIIGWEENFSFAESLLSDLGIKSSYRELCFPIGTMFWARPNGLKALFDLNLNWEDYPEEPLPYDGSLLHALERLFGMLVTHSGGSILLTNVSGSTR